MYSRDSRQHGFTVPELLIATAIATVLMVGIIAVLVNLLGNGSQVVRTTEQIRINQNTLSAIQADMPITQSFLATNDVADPDVAASPLASPSRWQLQGTGDSSRILILRTYATTAAPQDPARQMVYLDEGVGGCPVGRTPVTNNIIYFLKSGTLYRRILPNTTASPLCAGQAVGQRRTCTTPDGTSCREKDVVVATNINKFSVQYFSAASDTNPRNDTYTVSNADANNIVQAAAMVRIEIQSTTANPDDTPLLNSYRKMTKGNSRAL